MWLLRSCLIAFERAKQLIGRHSPLLANRNRYLSQVGLFLLFPLHSRCSQLVLARARDNCNALHWMPGKQSLELFTITYGVVRSEIARGDPHLCIKSNSSQRRKSNNIMKPRGQNTCSPSSSQHDQSARILFSSRRKTSGYTRSLCCFLADDEMEEWLGGK